MWAGVRPRDGRALISPTGLNLEGIPSWMERGKWVWGIVRGHLVLKKIPRTEWVWL